MKSNIKVEKENNIPNFKVPEGYFENFEEQIFSKISEEKFPKSTGFNVPQKYFENLEQRIFIPAEKSKKVIPLFPRKYFGYAAAVAACLIIGLTIFINKTDPQDLNTLQWSFIDSYIEDGNLNLDLYDLTTMINDSDISGIEVQELEFSQSDLEDYLFENIDTEILINER